LQFLSGKELTQAIKLIVNCLRPGGKAYLTTTSIYCPWLEDYLPTYNQRVTNGETWAGEIKNFTDYAPEEAKAYIPDFFHALTKEKLQSILVCNHFTIEKIYYYDLYAPYIHIVHPASFTNQAVLVSDMILADKEPYSLTHSKQLSSFMPMRPKEECI